MQVKVRYDGPIKAPIKKGDEIAQLVVTPILRARLVEQEQLTKTDRGTKGFGSTDKQTIDKRRKYRP